MGNFISYVLLGLSLAAPIGPINAAQLDRGLKSGFFSAWLIGLGSVVADILLMCTVYLGMVHIIEIPFVKAFLWLFGFFVLVYTGIESIVSAIQLGTDLRSSQESRIKTFFTGFFMALSNPLSVLFWLGIYGSILANTAKNTATDQLILYSCAIIIGLLLWDVTMAAVSSFFRKVLTTRVLKTISVLSGLSLVGFGIYFGIQAIILIF
ncbi:LysE family transporter [Caldalkalibacillus salinus]|uniref:LysE family transporter n=1 Tax=Caldalkalibacillus salinus TaxID=2803787 RepID=UPI001922D036|nr:LysE family transporter [Caldalkalibacillus salinus]